MSNVDVDVAIVGGGPAGSSTAAYLAKAGLKCAVFERELFPRLHVGESLVPATTRVLRDIGFLDQMDQCGFVRKFGAVWTSETSTLPYMHGFEDADFDGQADIRFEEREQPGVNQRHTWHVDRGKFDLLMLQHAQKLGATVYEGVKIGDIDFSDAAQPRVRFSLGNKDISLSAKVVVDASGRQTLLGNQLKLKKNDAIFNQYALHTWFDGYDRMTLAKSKDLESYIYIHFLPVTNTWIWQIPITETVTSIGVVTQKRNFEKSRESRENFFWNCVRTRPELYDALKKSVQMRPLKEEGDYSYGMSEICGDGFVMVGDAARFVDPIFSSGVSIAMTSAKLAANAIVKAAETGDFSQQSFETYRSTMRRGTNNWYEFINLYYRLNILFTYFLSQKKYRLDVLKLLQGDMYDDEKPPVLNEMRRIVTQVEERESHPWHKHLGNLTGDAFRAAF
ncbi:MAG TPA: NAD(P)/FAD-dependent oxidoreductase [Terriglobia bacterium]|nr:NAD(P)/FAD-dependent oxidoreductase [Terriglobia bacterium]